LVATKLTHTTVHFLLPIWKIGVHQTLEQLAVVGNPKVDQFVNDDDFPKTRIFPKEVPAKRDPP
jgi:hypothetical protein